MTKVEETDECMLVYIDWLGKRLWRCGFSDSDAWRFTTLEESGRGRDLSMRKLPLKLRYCPRRVACPRCGVRVEDFPWAEPWARVTRALSNAVAVLARELSWQGGPLARCNLVEGAPLRFHHAGQAFVTLSTLPSGSQNQATRTVPPGTARMPSSS